MHTGFLSSGHFYIYLRPNMGPYVLFNDENVQLCKDPKQFLDFSEKQFSSYPYILIYIRNDCKDELFCKQNHSIPDYVLNSNRGEEIKIQFTIRTPISLASNINEGFIGFSITNKSHQYVVEANSRQTFQELYQIV